MVAPVFTDEELESLRRFPEIGREELFRFFTLTRRTVRSSTRAGAGAEAGGPARARRCGVHAAVAGVRAGRRGLGTAGGRGTAGRIAAGTPADALNAVSLVAEGRSPGGVTPGRGS